MARRKGEVRELRRSRRRDCIRAVFFFGILGGVFRFFCEEAAMMMMLATDLKKKRFRELQEGTEIVVRLLFCIPG